MATIAGAEARLSEHLLGFPLGYRGPNTWVFFCCFPTCVSKELGTSNFYNTILFFSVGLPLLLCYVFSYTVFCAFVLISQRCHCSHFIVSFKVRQYMFFHFILSQNFSGYCKYFYFCIHFSIILLISTEDTARIFTGVALNQQIGFLMMGTLSMSSLSSTNMTALYLVEGARGVCNLSWQFCSFHCHVVHTFYQIYHFVLIYTYDVIIDSTLKINCRFLIDASYQVKKITYSIPGFIYFHLA